MTADLSAYKQKRDFERTQEPVGDTADSGEVLRYAVQHHMARREHYDLRLEWNGVLLSWAVPKGPSYNTRDKRLAVQVEDHPLDYRSFEGTIPQGEYGGGTVMLWDEGTWEPHGNVEEGLREGALKFTLHGKRLRGKWALVRLRAKEGESKENWLLLKEKDEYTGTSDGIADFTTSVSTGRTMEEIREGQSDKLTRNPFDKADVQLAKLASSIPQGADWLFELKYDGYRILAFVEGGGVRLMTRGGKDYTGRFQSIADSLAGWSVGRAMVLDGEMVVTDASGKTDFQALQGGTWGGGAGTLTYIVFDLLALDGGDLRSRTLTDRKATLEALMKNTPDCLHYSRHIQGDGEACFRAACEAGMEGVVGKKADSVYSGTRNGDWIKLKCDKRQEFVIGGYTLSDKKTRGVSSLLLGIYEGGELVYTGRAGTGLSQSGMRLLEEQFQKIQRASSPFRMAPKPHTNEKITWLEPQLVAEVKFAEWTAENLLRQASFKGIRTDKDPRDIRRERAEDEPDSPEPSEEGEKTMITADRDLIVQGVKITHPEKVLFEDPDITKAEVVRYYAAVAERMLPYVRGRILSIVRCPKGVSETCFYKKHPGKDSRGVVTVPVMGSDGETEDYFYIEDTAGLVSEAQMGTLEFHTWGSRVEELERPDMMVFDLDPDEGMDLERVRQGVLDLKSILAELSLTAYLKTSGGKGYHVVVPFRPAASWDAFHDFSRRIAEVMERKWPDRYTSNVRKSSRTNRIFIDWIRNGRGATSVAPYSIRARKGARVSMPIAWDELETVAPDGVDMPKALERLADDPWAGFFHNDQLLR